MTPQDLAQARCLLRMKEAEFAVALGVEVEELRRWNMPAGLGMDGSDAVPSSVAPRAAGLLVRAGMAERAGAPGRRTG